MPEQSSLQCQSNVTGNDLSCKVMTLICMSSDGVKKHSHLQKAVASVSLLYVISHAIYNLPSLGVMWVKYSSQHEKLSAATQFDIISVNPTQNCHLIQEPGDFVNVPMPIKEAWWSQSVIHPCSPLWSGVLLRQGFPANLLPHSQLHQYEMCG